MPAVLTSNPSEVAALAAEFEHASATEVVISGQDERAGRWTGFDKSECGIHTFLGDKI
jgi:hypothetical protein